MVLGGVIAVACAVGAMLGNPVIRAVLRRIDPAQPDGDADVRRARENLGLLQQELPGGRWVGVLERLATYVCIVTGFPAGIAVVLGVKGLGRYAELASPTSRKGELFIIGTFASMMWAAAFAGLALLGWRLV